MPKNFSAGERADDKADPADIADRCGAGGVIAAAAVSAPRPGRGRGRRQDGARLAHQYRAAYMASPSPAERREIAQEIQREILQNHYFVPLYRHAFMNAIGPRIAATRWQDVFPTVSAVYPYPWEDIRLKDG